MRKLFFILPILAITIIFFSCGKAEKKRYMIARVESWEPLDLYGSEKSLNGLLDDVLQQITDEEGVRFQIVTGEHQNFQQLLEKKEIDGVLTTFSVTPITARKFGFSDPFFVSGPVIVVNSLSRFRTIADLKNAEVGVDRNIFYSIPETPNPDWILRPYDSVYSALDKVAGGGLDGVVLNFVIAARLSHGLYAGKIRTLLPPLVTFTVRLVVRKDENSELVDLVNKGLEKLKASGLYDKMLAYWGLENALPQNR